MCKGDLNYLLQFFIHEVRKTNGDKYPRDSLKQLYARGIQYFFQNVLKKSYMACLLTQNSVRQENH